MLWFHLTRQRAPASKKQLTFLPFRAHLLQHNAHDCQHNGISPARIVRAYGNAVHAGNARFIIHLFRVSRIDCLCGARCGADTTVYALLGGFGYHAGVAVNTDQHGPGAVVVHPAQLLCRHRGNPAP